MEALYRLSNLIENLLEVQEIEHVDEVTLGEVAPDSKDSIFRLENVLIIPYSTFYIYYPLCQDYIEKSAQFNEEEFKNKIKEINLATRVMLLINGEVNSAFNRRIMMLKYSCIKDVKEELHFVTLINMKFKKSSISWYYRRVLIESIFEKDPDCFKILFEEENQIVANFFLKHPRNYYGWEYKKFLCKKMIEIFPDLEYLKQHYNDQKKFSERYIHDYSSFHYLQFMANHIKDLIDVEEEKKWAMDLMKKYESMYELEKQHHEGSKVNFFEMESVKKFLQFLEEFKNAEHKQELIQ